MKNFIWTICLCLFTISSAFAHNEIFGLSGEVSLSNYVYTLGYNSIKPDAIALYDYYLFEFREKPATPTAWETSPANTLNEGNAEGYIAVQNEVVVFMKHFSWLTYGKEYEVRVRVKDNANDVWSEPGAVVSFVATNKEVYAYDDTEVSLSNYLHTPGYNSIKNDQIAQAGYYLFEFREDDPTDPEGDYWTTDPTGIDSFVVASLYASSPNGGAVKFMKHMDGLEYDKSYQVRVRVKNFWEEDWSAPGPVRVIHATNKEVYAYDDTEISLSNYLYTPGYNSIKNDQIAQAGYYLFEFREDDPTDPEGDDWTTDPSGVDSFEVGSLHASSPNGGAVKFMKHMDGLEYDKSYQVRVRVKNFWDNQWSAPGPVRVIHATNKEVFAYDNTDVSLGTYIHTPGYNSTKNDQIAQAGYYLFEFREDDPTDPEGDNWTTDPTGIDSFEVASLYASSPNGGTVQFLKHLDGLQYDTSYQVRVRVKNFWSNDWSEPGPVRKFYAKNKQVYAYNDVDVSLANYIYTPGYNSTKNDQIAEAGFYLFEFRKDQGNAAWDTDDEVLTIGDFDLGTHSDHRKGSYASCANGSPVQFMKNISGLDYGQTYQVRVRAKNFANQPWSAPGDVRTFHAHPNERFMHANQTITFDHYLVTEGYNSTKTNGTQRAYFYYYEFSGDGVNWPEGPKATFNQGSTFAGTAVAAGEVVHLKNAPGVRAGQNYVRIRVKNEENDPWSLPGPVVAFTTNESCADLLSASTGVSQDVDNTVSPAALGQITLTSTSTHPEYTQYLWADGTDITKDFRHSLQAGTYDVTIWNHGCTADYSFVIKDDALPCDVNIDHKIVYEADETTIKHTKLDWTNHGQQIHDYNNDNKLNMCLQGGTVNFASIRDFHNNGGERIHIKVEGSPLIIDNDNKHYYAFNIDNGRDFELDGGDDADHHNYRIQIPQSYQIIDDVTKVKDGLGITGLSNNYEVHHVKIENTERGIVAKEDPVLYEEHTHRTVYTDYDQTGFVHDNISFHDLYIDNTVTEGMYIGSTHFSGDEVCGRTIYPLTMGNVSIYNVTAKNTMWDAIQLSSATNGINSIYDNTVENYGLEHKSAQSHGIMIGTGTGDIHIYNNSVKRGYGHSFEIRAYGDAFVYNNECVEAGYDVNGVAIPGTSSRGIYLRSREFLQYEDADLETYEIINNTILNTTGVGIKVIGEKPSNIFTSSAYSEIYNNLIVNAAVNLGSNEYYIECAYSDYESTARARMELANSEEDVQVMTTDATPILWFDIRNNIFRDADATDLHFVNGTLDIASNSVCKDAGYNNFIYRYKFDAKGDVANENRINGGTNYYYGGTIDVGAHEHQDGANRIAMMEEDHQYYVNDNQVVFDRMYEAIRIIDLQGRIIAESFNDDNIATQDLPNGIYVLQRSNKNSIATDKVFL